MKNCQLLDDEGVTEKKKKKRKNKKTPTAIHTCALKMNYTMHSVIPDIALSKLII
jgi:hypothetical protein